ncbi:MAG: hypothetical protein LBU75_16240 [Desulfovibrio sp.]|jgi:hypothetical protein|nr:hypothetical protein [Desulfovibrio sp.]
MPNDVSNDMTKDGASGQAPAVHEDPAACAPGAAAPALPAPPTLPASPVSPDVAETSAPTGPPTREDVRRFRLATLRARLALLGVAFDPSTDEATLRRMLRAVEGQGGEAARPGPKDVKGVTGAPGTPNSPDTAGATGAADMIDTTDTIGHAADPAPAGEPDLPPSAAMRRDTARHLRERQRVAAADIGVTGIAGGARGTNGRPRGRGRS